MFSRATLSLVFVLSLSFSGRAFALGQETFGPRDLGTANYTDWPGLAEVVNHSSRVYHRWVNGGESCFYRGSVEDLNTLLARFAQIQMEDHLVVLRPGMGATESWRVHDESGNVARESKTIVYNAQLSWVGGISALMSGAQAPQFTIFIDAADVLLEGLVFPEGIELQSPSTVRATLRAKLQSDKGETRRFAARELVRTEPYAAENTELLLTLLKDPDQSVRRTVATALSSMGKHAVSALPELRAAQEKEPEEEFFPRAIAAIEAAGPPRVLSERDLATLTAIEAFDATRNLTAPTASP